MNKLKPIIDRCDRITASIITTRDPYCRLKLEGCTGITDDPMHVFGRGNLSTRWNPCALFGGCRSCHDFIDTHPEKKKAIFMRIMGRKRYNALNLISNSVLKLLPSDIESIYNNLKEQLKLI